MDPTSEAARKKLILSATIGIALALAAGTPAAGWLLDGAVPSAQAASYAR